MESRERIFSIKVESAIERCEGLQSFLLALGTRIYASPGTGRVFEAARNAVEHLSSYLAGLKGDVDLQLLSEHELETTIHKRCSLLPILHGVLEMVERSDVGSVRAELLGSLRRHVRNHFPEGEIILVSKLHLNYTITELAGPLTDILNNYGLSLPTGFPRPLFLATIPAVEGDQALLHCILAHEVGHTLYTAKGLEAKILPVDIDQEYLKQIFQRFKKLAVPKPAQEGEEPVQQELPFDEVSFRENVTTGVNCTITNWITELSSDVYGVLTFGPAFLFSFLHFTTAFQRLDASGVSHPPGRLRLRLQFMALDELYQKDAFSPVAWEFLEDWRKIATAEPDNAGGLFEHIALRSLDDSVRRRILDSAKASLAADKLYSAPQYKQAVKELVPLINAHIPPAEILRDGAYCPTGAVDMLNAGWEVFINGCGDFRAEMKPDVTTATVHAKLNDLMMKSLELFEARQTWDEVSRAPKH